MTVNVCLSQIKCAFSCAWKLKRMLIWRNKNDCWNDIMEMRKIISIINSCLSADWRAYHYVTLILTLHGKSQTSQLRLLCSGPPPPPVLTNNPREPAALGRLKRQRCVVLVLSLATFPDSDVIRAFNNVTCDVLVLAGGWDFMQCISRSAKTLANQTEYQAVGLFVELFSVFGPV